MAQRFVNPAPRYFDDEGNLLSYGRLYFYRAGTLIAKDTFSDPELSIPNTNPVRLSGSGLQPDIYGDGSYRMVCTDRFDREIFDRDNVSVLQLPFSAWNSTYIYGDGGGNIVYASDGNYYVSIAVGNSGNDPTLSPTKWEQIAFFPGTVADATNVIQMAELDPDDQHIIIGDGTDWVTAPIAEYLYAYLQGLITSNSSGDTEHDISVATGTCADSTNARMMTLSTAITKRIDATWAAGTNAGGLASGATLTLNQTYHVFVVQAAGVVDVMFDSSVTCANGVANNAVTCFRRIASIRTDASSNIINYVQTGDTFTLLTPINSYDADYTGGSATVLPVIVPANVLCLINLGVTAIADAGGIDTYLYVYSAAMPTPSMPSSASTIILLSATVDTSNSIQIQVGSNTGTTARMIMTAVGAGDVRVIINSLGWEDYRGK